MKAQQLFGKTLFVDFLLSNVAVLLSLVMLNDFSHKQKQEPQEKKEDAALQTDGKFAIVVDWPDASNDDVDLYVKDPAGNIAFFQQESAGLMHLENDDRGAISDQVITASGTVSVQKNQERVIIRDTVPGEYIVNVQMFAKRDTAPTPISISLYRLKGNDTKIKNAELVQTHDGDEHTAFRFTVGADGEVASYSDLQIKLVGAAGASTNGGAMPMPGGPI